MRVSTPIALFIATAFLTAPASFAQDNAAMEKILAVVGKEIILKSDVDGQVEIFAQRSPGINKNDPLLRQSILDQMINERLIMSKAVEDSLDVSEDEITMRMDNQIAMLVQQVGSEKRIEDIYGMSMARIKREFRDEIRKQLLVEKMRQKQFGNIKASRFDVENFYNKFKDSIPVIPPRVDIYHIVKYIQASDEQKKETYVQALRIRDSLVKGASFGDFARKYSADPSSAKDGGDLGFVDKGKFVPAFEQAAFALQPNEISQPVETPFGWHIIQLIEKTPTSINTRHILLRVGQSEADRERVRTALLEVKNLVVNNKQDFEKLAKTESEEKETQGFGGSMGQVELQRLPEDMRETIASLNDGGVSDPLPYAADPSKPGYHIIYRKMAIREHKATLEQDYKMIEQLATYEKKQRMEQDWVLKLRRTLYWELR